MAQTVQEKRHEIRDTLRGSLTGVQGSISDILALLEGRPGLTPEEQVALLGNVQTATSVLRETLVTAAASLQHVEELAVEAATLAAERDFEAHQQEKAELRAASEQQEQGA